MPGGYRRRITDLAVFTQGAIRHTRGDPPSPASVTNDIAMALRTPTAEAERDQDRHGVAAHPGRCLEMIEVPGCRRSPLPAKLSPVRPWPM